MDVTRFVVCLIYIVVYTDVCQAWSYDIIYMDHNCGNGVSMSESAVQLDLTSRHAYNPNMDCWMTIAAPAGSDLKLMVKFNSLNIESSTNCMDDRLMMYDGTTTTGRHLVGPAGLCGFTSPPLVYITQTNALTLTFLSDTTRQYKGFTLIITEFRDAVQNDTDFRCNNNRYIDSGLRCDGWDNCGDNTDETKSCGLTSHERAGIIIGVCVTLFLISIAGLVVYRRRGWKCRPRELLCRIPKKDPSGNPLCVKFKASQKDKVGNIQPASVRVYYYYEPDKVSCTEFYRPDGKSGVYQKLCEDDVCKCAEGYCPKDYNKEERWAIRVVTLMKEACTKADYVYKVKVTEVLKQNVSNGALQLEYKADIKVLKPGGDEDAPDAKRVNFFIRQSCPFPVLENGEEYLIMGKDGQIIEDQSMRYQLDNEAFVMKYYNKNNRMLNVNDRHLGNYMDKLEKQLDKGCPQ